MTPKRIWQRRQMSPSRGEGDGGPAADDPEERQQAHALLTRAVSDPDWQAASQALEDLMRKLLVVHRLLEAEERLPKWERRADSM